MDPKLLLSHPRPSLPTPFPHASHCRASCFPHLYRSSAFSGSIHLSFRPKTHENAQILGEGLVFHGLGIDYSTRRKSQSRFPPVPICAAAVKRRKEMPFDNVIQRDKKLKLVMKIRRILVSQPDRIMSLTELGRYRRDLGLTRNRRFIALLKRFPAVFQIAEEGVYSLKFRLTPTAEQIYLEELKVRNEMEELLVTKLRKLLMMSLDKRIPIEKIAHFKTDLGLPAEFRDSICKRYPQYFKVVRTDRGPVLELMHWDAALAVSAAEIGEGENRVREMEERNLIIDRSPKFTRVKLPKGLNLSKGEMRRISQFRDIPYLSPYSDHSSLRAGTPEKEKHACGVAHEILSLTTEKRTLVDHLTHFREEFGFSQQLRGMLIRHPDMFYVSLKGDRDSVFLREAYHDSHLVEKDKLLILKEKMRALVAVPRFGRRGAPNGVGSAGDKGSVERTDDGDDEEWSDDDDFVQGGKSDEFYEDDDKENDNEEDDLSDEDDEMPPDFDDDGSLSYQQTKPVKTVHSAPKTDEILVPVLPDGRPRECW